jgi:L-fuculose-phosphate aldolase
MKDASTMTQALKEKLALAGRILDLEDQGDFVLGHVTARLPDDPEHFLMKPAAIGFEEMSAENVITVNLAGEKVAGAMGRHSEVFIHSEIMRARPEIQSVVHTHAPHAVAFASLGRPLLPVGHYGSLFCDGVPVFAETTMLITTPALGQAVARTLGAHDALFLRNHGIVTAGRTLEEAVYLALTLEKACKLQLMVEACGGPKLVTDPEEALLKKKRISRPEAHRNIFEYLVRKAGRRHRD